MSAARQRCGCSRCCFRRATCARARAFCTSARRKRRTRCYWVRRLYRKSSGNPLLARAFGLLAGALAAAEAASPLLPAGFVRWLLLIAAFLIGGALSAVILHAPSAYYQGKKMFVALAALAAVALLTLAQFGEGLLAVLLVIVCLVLLGLLTLHAGGRPSATRSSRRR